MTGRIRIHFKEFLISIYYFKVPVATGGSAFIIKRMQIELKGGRVQKRHKIKTSSDQKVKHPTNLPRKYG